MITKPEIIAPINHIRLDNRGVAFVGETRLKVEHVVGAKNHWGMTPERIQEGYDFLTLGQVYAALAYYYDHKEEMDACMQRESEEFEAMRTADEKRNPHDLLKKRNITGTINSYDDLQNTLRHWTSFKDQHAYDVVGLTVLLAACFDNLEEFALEADYDQIRDCFTEEQRQFIKTFAGKI